VRGRATLRQCPPHQELRATEASEEAATDALTGLSTFRVLQGRLAQEIWRSQRNGEPFGVLFLDLDRFKLVNDIHGHAAGNKLLQAVGREISKVVRKTDVAARYGGDEFVLILVGTDIHGVRRVGELVRERVERVGRSLGYTEEAVTASIGAATFSPQEDVDPEEALARADRAVFVAKGKGGNYVAMATAEGDDVTVKEV
jgi:diguanylate cyclase (GGDEF)-like protein